AHGRRYAWACGSCGLPREIAARHGGPRAGLECEAGRSAGRDSKPLILYNYLILKNILFCS
ncbi:MAG: hypothetical protein AABZ67_01890, partial [Pseudomonadota bacterium]